MPPNLTSIQGTYFIAKVVWEWVLDYGFHGSFGYHTSQRLPDKERDEIATLIHRPEDNIWEDSVHFKA